MTNCIESHELSAWRISWNLELVGARGWSRIRIQKKRVKILAVRLAKPLTRRPLPSSASSGRSRDTINHILGIEELFLYYCL